MLTSEHKAAIRTMRRGQDAVIAAVADKPKAINEAVALIREWVPGTYRIGDVRQHGEIPYKCVQAHDSTDNPQWTPEAVPALWMQYHGTSVESSRAYIQPLGAHDAYKVDEYAIEDGKMYRCKADATIWPPSVLPGSWELIS